MARNTNSISSNFTFESTQNPHISTISTKFTWTCVPCLDYYCFEHGFCVIVNCDMGWIVRDVRANYDALTTPPITTPRVLSSWFAHHDIMCTIVLWKPHKVYHVRMLNYWFKHCVLCDRGLRYGVDCARRMCQLWRASANPPCSIFMVRTSGYDVYHRVMKTTLWKWCFLCRFVGDLVEPLVGLIQCGASLWLMMFFIIMVRGTYRSGEFVRPWTLAYRGSAPIWISNTPLPWNVGTPTGEHVREYVGVPRAVVVKILSREYWMSILPDSQTRSTVTLQFEH